MSELADAEEVIGRYELLTRLATGGMAELFLARERGLAGLERLVVIKRILPHLADQESFVEMFLREARIVARLSHPNVIQIYELGQESDTYYIAMEYIHGSTVREMLLLAQDDDRELPVDVAMAIADQGCRGLHAAHELEDLDGEPMGLVHRDVSPHNLMCATDGHVKLLDFGVAKSTSASAEATYSGNLKGKFAYLSPEQCLHEPLDRRSDVFAMAIVMWEMLTMRRLFKRDSELAMMQAVTGGDVPSVRKFRPEVPEEIEEVIMEGLRTDRDERFDSAEQMRLQLVDAAQQSGVEWSEKRITEFMDDVAGDRLDERKQTVENACERELTVAERRRLLHMRGTDSRASMQQADPDDPTLVERPSDGSDVTRQSPPDRIKELIETDRRRTDDADPMDPTAVERPDESTEIEALADDSTTETVQNQRQAPDVDADEPAVRREILVLTLVIGAISIALSFYALLGDDEPTDDPTQEAVELAPELQAHADMLAAEVEHSAWRTAASAAGESITFGLAPTIDPDALAAEMWPIYRYLEEEIERPVHMSMADSYTDLAHRIGTGELSMAMLPPTLYVLATNRYDDIEMVAMREFDGTDSSDGHLVVRRGSAIGDFEDLEGETFCLVDRASTSGHLLPRHFLRKEGHDPDEFIGEIHWSGDHFQAMRDLIDDKCKAAAVYSGAYLSADDYGISSARLSTLDTTGTLPQDFIAVRSSVDAEIRDALEDALTSFDSLADLGVRRVGENQRITGFLKRDESDVATLRDIVAEEGLDLGDL